LSLCSSKFRFISSMVLPIGGPEGTNTQAQSEQPQPWIRSTHSILRAMHDYSDFCPEPQLNPSMALESSLRAFRRIPGRGTHSHSAIFSVEIECRAPNPFPIESRRPFLQYPQGLSALWVLGHSVDSDRWDRLADSLAALYDHCEYLASSERSACQDYCSPEGSARWGCSADYWDC
jgi:hypothetical protein